MVNVPSIWKRPFFFWFSILRRFSHKFTSLLDSPNEQLNVYSVASQGQS